MIIPTRRDDRISLGLDTGAIGNEMRFAKSLKGRLTIIVAVAIVVTGTVVLLYGFFIARAMLREQVYDSIEAVLTRTKRDIQNAMINMSEAATLVASSTSLSRHLQAFLEAGDGQGEPSAEMHEILEESQRAVPNFFDLSVVSLEGGFVAGYTTRSRIDARRHETPVGEVVETVLSQGLWNDFEVLDGEVVITIASGVYAPGDERLIGLVMIESLAPGIERSLADRSGLGDSGEILLSKITDDKVTVLNISEEPGIPGSIEEEEVVIAGVSEEYPTVKAAGGEKGQGEATSVMGGHVVAAYDYIPEVDWGLTALADSAEAFAPVNRLRNVIIVVIVVLVFGGSLLAYLIARSITRPLVELQDGVKALAGGELSTRVTISDGTEVTSLADEFNRMANRLNELYENLERKVEERTRELKDANSRLQELDQLKSEFVSVASHELRSPLASMKMGISNVANEVVGELNEEQKLMLTIVDRNLDRLTKLTTDLLDITKIEARQLDLKREECDLVGIAREVVESAVPQAEHQGLYLKVEPGHGRVMARCDRDRIYQVILNLVSNALRFTDEGGVTIKVERGAASGIEPEGEEVADLLARVCIEDTGVGIPSEAIGTVFEKFSQAHSETRSEKRGTGLGLAISRGIVEAHGGTITVDSEVDVGSRFCFTIPLDGEDEGKEEDTHS